jgi:hypothetical protein
MKVWQIAAGDVGRDYSSLFFDYDIMILGPSLALGDALDNPDKYSESIPNSQNNQVWNFANRPEPGDRVLMRYKKEVIGIGQIPMEFENQYSFQEQFKCVYGWDLCHTRRVRWTNKKFDLPKKIRNAFVDRKQQPTFTEVHDPLDMDVIEFKTNQFDRPLKNLPNINFKDYSEDELGRELFKNGISNKNIDDIIKALNQADRLIRWYLSDNSGRYPTEHEIVSHIILPIFLGLGWSHQQIAVEWNRIDVAFFKTTPTIERSCVMIIEAKGLGTSLGEVLEQPLNYMKNLKLDNVKLIITTDGANVFVYSVSKNKVDEVPVGFFNVNHLQQEYIIPKEINLVDTLVKLQPISL